MNKSELIAKVAEVSGVSQGDTEKVINGFTTAVKDALVAGDKVQLVGFGSFETTTRAAHEGRNPRTGDKIQVAESRAAKFYPGGPLKDALNPAK